MGNNQSNVFFHLYIWNLQKLRYTDFVLIILFFDAIALTQILFMENRKISPLPCSQGR